MTIHKVRSITVAAALQSPGAGQWSCEASPVAETQHGRHATGPPHPRLLLTTRLRPGSLDNITLA